VRQSIAIHCRIDLPPTFGGLQGRATAADIPVLRQRKNLTGPDRWIPDIQVTVAATVNDI
jgi:hypothetical protein